jgi:hypothetical protein
VQLRGDRLALVIGNSKYVWWRGFLPLDCADEDASGMEKWLQEHGYKVFIVRNGKKAEMMQELDKIAACMRHGCTVVVYFSGHGTKDNRLVPVDAVFRFGCISFNTVMTKLGESLEKSTGGTGSAVVCALLDCCRSGHSLPKLLYQG